MSIEVPYLRAMEEIVHEYLMTKEDFLILCKYLKESDMDEVRYIHYCLKKITDKETDVRLKMEYEMILLLKLRKMVYFLFMEDWFDT